MNKIQLQQQSKYATPTKITAITTKQHQKLQKQQRQQQLSLSLMFITIHQQRTK